MSEEKLSVENKEKDASSVSDIGGHKEVKHLDNVGRNINAKLANPLAGIPADQLMEDGANFAQERGLGHLKDVFRKAALVAQDPTAFESLDILNEDDKAVLRREITHRWSQPWQLYYLVILCSMAAAVQGVSVLARRIQTFLYDLPLHLRTDGRVGNQWSQFVFCQSIRDPSELRQRWSQPVVARSGQLCPICTLNIIYPSVSVF